MSEIELRPLQENDAENILTWVNNPDVVGNIAAFASADFTLEQELAYVRKMRASDTDKVFSIFHEDGTYLGQVGLHDLYKGVARLAIVIGNTDYFGKGYGGAAIVQALDHAFAELGLHKVYLMVMASNERSRALYSRIGFRSEGLLRQEYFHNGEYHDMVRMSVLASEYPPIAD